MNQCIKSIKESDYRNYEIIVADNNSSDKSIDLLAREYPDVHVIRNIDNYGFAKGNNIAIKYAIDNNSEYILLLNNDTELDSMLLKNLVERANPFTVTVPKIYYYKPGDLLWYSGGYIDWLRGTTMHTGINEQDRGLYDSESYEEFAPACCMLIHSSIFRKVGYFDESYFMYYEDSDFCLRLAENGIKILYLPQAKLLHKVSSSTGGEESFINEYYMTRNRMYFINKFKKPKLIPYIYSISAIYKRMLIKKIKHMDKDFQIIKMGLNDYFANRMGKKDLS